MYLWEQQQNETAKAYEAARAYFEIGANRSIAAVAQKYSKSIALLMRWSAKHNWVNREMSDCNRAYGAHSSHLPL